MWTTFLGQGRHLHPVAANLWISPLRRAWGLLVSDRPEDPLGANKGEQHRDQTKEHERRQ